MRAVPGAHVRGGLCAEGSRAAQGRPQPHRQHDRAQQQLLPIRGLGDSYFQGHDGGAGGWHPLDPLLRAPPPPPPPPRPPNTHRFRSPAVLTVGYQNCVASSKQLPHVAVLQNTNWHACQLSSLSAPFTACMPASDPSIQFTKSMLCRIRRSLRGWARPSTMRYFTKPRSPPPPPPAGPCLTSLQHWLGQLFLHHVQPISSNGFHRLWALDVPAGR